MHAVPVLEVGQSVLVAPKPDDAPLRMVVDLVQAGHVTLATVDDEKLPPEWHELDEVHLTSLDRFNVHFIHVPVVRGGETRLVIGEPDDSMPRHRRAYARVYEPVPASCMLLDAADNSWMPFPADIRDLGGGGCSLTANMIAPEGASIVISFALDDREPIVAVGRVLPREELPTIGRPFTRVEFVMIREVERDRILRFVLLTLVGRKPSRDFRAS
jgi:hypothetical protein